MASILERLKRIGVGVKSDAQSEREKSPVLSSMSQRRQPSLADIQEQERINRARGVTYDRFDGRRGLRSGEKLINIGGVTYVVPETEFDKTMLSKMQTQSMNPMVPGTQGLSDVGLFGITEPPIAPAIPEQRMPVQQEIVPEQGREDVTIDVMPVRPNVTLPDIPAPLDVPVPVRTEVAPQVPETSLPTRIDMSRLTTVAKPDLDSILDNLLARTAGITDTELPVPSAGAFTPKMTKSVVPSRAARMGRGTNIPIPPMPDMSTPDIQPYLPDMFTGQLPMPEPPSQLFVDEAGNLVDAVGNVIEPRVTQLQDYSDEELDAIIEAERLRASEFDFLNQEK